MIAKTLSVALTGIDGTIVEVETDMKQGLPGMQIVGMGSKAVNEARERIRSALSHSSLPLPARKFTINLAPAELPKEGAHFDLALAVSLLVATGQLHPHEAADCAFVGELSLDGRLKPVRGALVILDAVSRAEIPVAFIPEAHAAQASLVPSLTVYPVGNLKQLYLHLKGIRPLSPIKRLRVPQSRRPADITLDDIVGQPQAKRALEIAIAGRHPLLFYGPPGTGKTLLAHAIPGLLPPLSRREQLEVTKLHSLSGDTTGDTMTAPPFRSPHHTISPKALIGGGNKGQPGELSLAHRGVLYLDELPEFQRASLETLRQPLERGSVTITRLYGALTYPCTVMLAASMNPCPCGYYGDPAIDCRCSEQQVRAYQSRLSGPFLDRIHVFVPVGRSEVSNTTVSKPLKYTQQLEVLKHIRFAQAIQQKRYKQSDKYNAQLSSRDVRTYCRLGPDAEALLVQATDRLQLSTRGYFTTLKLARTIADLAGAAAITPDHIAEALQLRSPFPRI